VIADALDRLALINNKYNYMGKTIKHFNYPVKDLEMAKKLYGPLIGVEPYVDEGFYVGYRIGDQEIGLDPNAHSLGITGPVGFFTVDDIKKSLESLVDNGARILQDAKDVGGGLLIAYIKDADNNVTGLSQFP
jgi:predicted enzyme related to lactoylglutathione lyase